MTATFCWLAILLDGLTLKMQALQVFKTMRTTTQHYIPDDMNPKQCYDMEQCANIFVLNTTQSSSFSASSTVITVPKI